MNTTSDKREFERLPVDFVLEVSAQDIDGKGFRDAGVLNDVSGEGAKFLTRNIDQTLKVQSVQLLKYAEDLARSYEKLKKEEKVRDRLSRYVEKSLVEKMIRGEEETPLKNERKDVTVLFADIRSFTRVVEGMDAQNVVSMLNEFFNIMVDIIFRNNGVLDKFIVDIGPMALKQLSVRYSSDHCF